MCRGIVYLLERIRKTLAAVQVIVHYICRKHKQSEHSWAGFTDAALGNVLSVRRSLKIIYIIIYLRINSAIIISVRTVFVTTGARNQQSVSRFLMNCVC